MKRTTFLLACLATSAIVLGCAGGDDETETSVTADPTSETGGGSPTPDEGEPASKDIVDTAVAAGGFETLVAAVKAAGLVETLKGEGPFTVLAPTDDAFAALPEGTVEDLLKPENKDKLVSILTYHVVPAKAMSSDVVKMTSATTVQGGDVAISVEEGVVKINDATVVTADIECSNGVIHVIDAVILPSE